MDARLLRAFATDEDRFMPFEDLVEPIEVDVSVLWRDAPPLS